MRPPWRWLGQVGGMRGASRSPGRCAGRLLFARLPLIKLAPTLASTAALLVTLKCSRNPLALPGVKPPPDPPSTPPAACSHAGRCFPRPAATRHCASSSIPMSVPGRLSNWLEPQAQALPRHLSSETGTAICSH